MVQLEGGGGGRGWGDRRWQGEQGVRWEDRWLRQVGEQMGGGTDGETGGTGGGGQVVGHVGSGTGRTGGWNKWGGNR